MNKKVEKNIKNASLPHIIETYTFNNTGKDWFLIGGVAFMIGFGLVALIILGN